MTTIEYDDIFDKCAMLTAYEGGQLRDGAGETMMEVVTINEQDRPLIIEYAEQGHNVFASALKFAINTTASSETDFQYDWAVGNSLAVKPNTKKHIIETISAYCVWHWLENKDPKRSESYKVIYETMLSAIMRQANKVKPTLT